MTKLNSMQCSRYVFQLQLLMRYRTTVAQRPQAS